MIPKVPEGKVWICSIDPGKCNFAFIIEEFDIDKLKKIKNIPKLKRFLKDKPTKEYLSLLDEMFLSGKTILLENLNITQGTTKEKYIDTKIFNNLNDALDKYLPYFDQCSHILIEMQMSFGKKKNNTMALKVAQHAFSYFTIFYRNFKEILEFPAYHKTKILGAEKGLDKSQRKKWAIQKAEEIWLLRDDFKTISKVGGKKKKDDMSDVLVQCCAFVYLRWIDKII